MKPVLESAHRLNIQISDEEIKPGDTYMAQRNTGPHLLTCRKIVDGYIVPTENAYFFDLSECVKVID